MICATVWVAMAGAATATQVFVGNTIDFTPADAAAGTTVAWAMPTASWEAFEASTYSHNENWTVAAPFVTTTSYSVPGGGTVFHFQSSTATAMDVTLAVQYAFGNWDGHLFDVYFSDTNDWSALSAMVGGQWSGWDPQATPEGLDPNPLWTNIYSHRMWGANGWNTPTLPSEGTLTSTDGNFYVRVDMQATNYNSSGSDWLAFYGLTVTGTVVPEPMTLAMLAMGGVAMIRRRGA
jgi:hypothetical protein